MAASNERSNTTANPMERELVITWVFDAPPELVFKAWTDPEHLARWWGPNGWTNTVCEVDARVGGVWRIVMRGPDGVEFPGHGLYQEIVEPERLVFTNIALDKDGNRLLDGVTTVTFEDAGGKTKLTLHTRVVGLVAFAGLMLEGMEPGWNQGLDRLAEELAMAIQWAQKP